MDPLALTPTVLNLVKSGIIDLMVRMYILPLSMLQSVVMRRIRRNAVIYDSENDNEITPVPSRNRPRVLTTESSAPTDVDNADSINVSSPIYKAMMLLDLGLIKELWRAGDYDEVGWREIALLAVYEGRDGISANAVINDYARHGSTKAYLQSFSK